MQHFLRNCGIVACRFQEVGRWPVGIDSDSVRLHFAHLPEISSSVYQHYGINAKKLICYALCTYAPYIVRRHSTASIIVRLGESRIVAPPFTLEEMF